MRVSRASAAKGGRTDNFSNRPTRTFGGRSKDYTKQKYICISSPPREARGDHNSLQTNSFISELFVHIHLYTVCVCTQFSYSKTQELPTITETHICRRNFAYIV